MQHRSTETVYTGALIDLERREYQAEHGLRQYEIISHPGAAVIFATPTRDSLVLVEQWRVAAAQRLWEVPAGVLDAGEDPAHAAARELREETGYRAAHIRPLWCAYSAPGFSTEKLHFYHAHELTLGERELDEDEASLIVRTFTLAELRALLAAGTIRDLKTVAAIYWLADYATGGEAA